MRFRKATEKDSENLFNWRNDPETRAESLNTAPVLREAHEAWLARTLKNPKRILFIVEEENEAVGAMRADKLENEDGYELSWTVAPNVRGRGVGKQMLIQAISGEINAPVFKAVIKRENIASIKMAQAAGFKQESEEKGVLVWYLRR